MNEIEKLQVDLAAELKRDDRIGNAERRAAVKRSLMLLDTIDSLCRESLGNYRLLEHMLDDDAEGDDLEELEEYAPDGSTLDVLVNAIFAGDLKGSGVFASRLMHLVLPRLTQFWDSRLKEQSLYRPMNWTDDVNLKGLEGYQLEAKCSSCGQVFVPLPESFVGLNNQQMGLYEHYQRMTDEGEKDCGGYGLITGGYKGTELILK